jgi:arylsulfatase
MSDRPNILFIMTDQQRGDCLGLEGHPALLTPNMDWIGADGVRFSRAYSCCPSCIATRRSLMSGQYPPTHGMVGYQDGVTWDAPATLPGVLRDNGYQTWLVGRNMHLHPGRKRYGFDHMVQFGQANDYYKMLRREAPESGGWFGGGVMHNDRTARPWHLPEHLHPTNWTVNEALRFMEVRDPSCPFFLVASFLAPHPPLQPPEFYMNRYLRLDLPEPYIGDWEEEPKGAGLGLDVSSQECHLTGEMLRSARAGYYGLINHVDDQIRRLINGIDGVDRNNTIVVFNSDHGEMLGDHYRWHKLLALEPAARVPLLIRAPRRFGIGPGGVVDRPVSHEDIMPTLLDMVGMDIPETVEGRSLYPLMRGEDPDPEWRTHLHIEHAPIHQSLTDGREKFIWHVADGRELFFNLAEDPNELCDLSGHPEWEERVTCWRQILIEELKGRPEGFTDGEKLIPGRPYGPRLPHAGEHRPELGGRERF